MVVLRQVTGKQAKVRLDGTLQWERAESALKAEGTQTIRKYTNKRQATVAQWVDL